MGYPTDGLADVERVRRWLANLGRPERLADPDMRALLRAHGKDPGQGPLDAGRAARALLEEAIAALEPDGGTGAASLPHRVLVTCFVEGIKSQAAAARLGLSERQLSRERSRAMTLLAQQLVPPLGGMPSAPPPPPDPFLCRTALDRALVDAIGAGGRVSVTGGPGAGKTALVAARAARQGRTFWLGGFALELPSVLFELGEHLASEDASLAGYVRGALPTPHLGLATRIALTALAKRRRLLVFDDFDDADPAVEAFVGEVADRLPLASVVTITRACRRGPRHVAIPPFTVAETRTMLGLHGIEADARMAAELHRWTGGNPRVVVAAARRLAAATGGLVPAEAAGVPRVPASVLAGLRGLTQAARRAA